MLDKRARALRGGLAARRLREVGAVPVGTGARLRDVWLRIVEILVAVCPRRRRVGRRQYFLWGGESAGGWQGLHWGQEWGWYCCD